MIFGKGSRSLARFSGPEASNRTRSLADFITTMSGFRFLVYTAVLVHQYDHQHVKILFAIGTRMRAEALQQN
jgi:hypothetical protein